MILKTIIIYGAVALIIAGSITGGVYLYKDNALKNSDINNFVQIANKDDLAKARLKADLALNAIIIKEYPSIQGSLHMTDSFFVNPNSTDPVINIPDVTKQNKEVIDNLRKNINDELVILDNSVKILKQDSPLNITLVNQINNEIVSLNYYMAQLQSIAQGLNPSSNLTAEQITSIQNTISSAQNTLSSSSNSIASAENISSVNVSNNQVYTTTPVQTSTNSSTQNSSQNSNLTTGSTQQSGTQTSPTGSTNTSTDSNTTNNTTTYTSTTNTSSSSSTTTSTSSQQLQLDANGHPKLIEGANKY